MSLVDTRIRMTGSDRRRDNLAFEVKVSSSSSSFLLLLLLLLLCGAGALALPTARLDEYQERKRHYYRTQRDSDVRDFTDINQESWRGAGERITAS